MPLLLDMCEDVLFMLLLLLLMMMMMMMQVRGPAR